MKRRNFLRGTGAIPADAGVAGCGRVREQRRFPPLNRRIDPDTLPGAVWLVAQSDDLVVSVSGTQATGSEAPMRHGFRIASMTRAVTAAAVLMLVEEGARLPGSNPRLGGG